MLYFLALVGKSRNDYWHFRWYSTWFTTFSRSYLQYLISLQSCYGWDIDTRIYSQNAICTDEIFILYIQLILWLICIYVYINFHRYVSAYIISINLIISGDNTCAIFNISNPNCQNSQYYFIHFHSFSMACYP